MKKKYNGPFEWWNKEGEGVVKNFRGEPEPLQIDFTGNANNLMT
jgi:hypothetical protein